MAPARTTTEARIILCSKRQLSRRRSSSSLTLLVVVLLLVLVTSMPFTVLAQAGVDQVAAAAAKNVVKDEQVIDEQKKEVPKQEVNAASEEHEEHLHRLRVPKEEKKDETVDTKSDTIAEKVNVVETPKEVENPAEETKGAAVDQAKGDPVVKPETTQQQDVKDATINADQEDPVVKDPADDEGKAVDAAGETSLKEKVLHVVGEKSKEQKKEEAKQEAKKQAATNELPSAANDTKTEPEKPETEDEIGESAAKSDDSDDEEENPEDYYFYAFDEESPVIELPRYEGDTDMAPFLDKPSPGEIRIVEFYAHWCPHCEKFRPKYNKFAKRMMEIAEQSGLKLKVYAISCVPHKSICRGNGVKNYPRIKMYLADSTTPIALNHKKVHPFEVLKKLGAENAFQDVEEEWEKEDAEEEEHEHAPDSAAALLGSGESFWIPRTKKEIYHDAYLSFDFTMRNSIFTSKEPMSEDQQEAFADFIHVLSEVLPPTWRLQWLVAELAENIEEALESEEKLLAIVDKYPPKKKKWSKSCTRGKGHMGYTCGLWQLFHIMTLGVVEWNLNNVAGKKKTYYTADEVGEVLRYFIEHFFGCEVCKVNFMQEYDSCSFNRCERLADVVGEFNDWKELPLWLFEFHNGVNTRLLKERAEAAGTTVSQDDMTAVEWPSRNHCPACWHEDGRFDPDRVYMFLELIYWPDELISQSKMAELVAFTSQKQMLQSAQEEEDPIPEEGFESWVYSLAGLVVASTVLSAASWVHKRKEIQRTGKHKKEDDESTKC